MTNAENGLFLNSNSVKGLIKEVNLIDNADPKQVEYMEGGTYDLRVAEVVRMVQGVPGLIGVDKRITPKTQPLEPRPLVKGEDLGWVLYPGKVYLIKTMEKINCPNYLRAWVTHKTTIFRDGAEFVFPIRGGKPGEPEQNLHIAAGMIQPGYEGELAFKMKVDGPELIELEQYARVAGICFSRLEAPEEDSYDKKGKWQGGKMSSQGQEMEAH